jgi:CheY-like chemotaxis protein
MDNTAHVGHRCDFPDRSLVQYSQSPPSEMKVLSHRTDPSCLGSRSATKPVPTDKMNATTATDILIIEDDAIMREAIGEWLQAAGYGVRKAADGYAGLAAVKLAVPALVVTDIYLPGTSGVAVIAELKQGYPGIPIIAISGLFNTGHGITADSAIALGAARALAKPFRRDELLRAVADLFGSHSP